MKTRDYQTTRQQVEELFRDNLRLYPEMYPADNLEESNATAERVAKGYWENRTDDEIENDTENGITESDYVSWCKKEVNQRLTQMSSEELDEIIEGRKHDFEIHTKRGTIYAHKVAGGFIETSDHGETQFTSLSKEELIEYYKENDLA